MMAQMAYTDNGDETTHPDASNQNISPLMIQSYNEEIEKVINFLKDCPPILELKLLAILNDEVQNKIKIIQLKDAYPTETSNQAKEDSKNPSEVVRYLPQLCPQCTMKCGIQNDHDYTVIDGITARHVLHSDNIESYFDLEEFLSPMTSKVFRCDQAGCPYATTLEEDFRTHLSKHYVHSLTFDSIAIGYFDQDVEKKKPPVTKKMHKCDRCDYETIHRSTIRAHIQSHIRKEQPETCEPRKSYDCTHCDYRTLRKRRLLDHLSKTHNEGESVAITCEICGFSGPPSYIRNLHMRRHMRIMSHFCSICDFGCHSQYHLTRHMRSKHTRPHKCQQCRFKTETQENLDMHVETRHPVLSTRHPVMRTGIKKRKYEDPGRHSCHLCAYKCPRKAHLKRHLTSMHAVEMGLVDEPNLYKCDLCEYRSHKKDLIGRHVRKIHKDAGTPHAQEIQSEQSCSDSDELIL